MADASIILSALIGFLAIICFGGSAKAMVNRDYDEAKSLATVGVICVILSVHSAFAFVSATYGHVVQAPQKLELTIHTEKMLLAEAGGQTFIIDAQVVPDSLLCDGNKVIFKTEKLLSGEERVVVSGVPCRP